VAETLGTTPDALYDTGEGKNRGLKKNNLWKIVERLEVIPEKEREKVYAIIDNYLKNKSIKKNK
jgi:hypothetical protein